MATHRPQEDAGPLGVPLSEHDRNSGRNHTFIVLLAVGGLIAVLAGPLMRSQGVNGGVCVSGFGLLLILLAGWSGYVAWRDRDLRVRVYEGGLVQRKGGTERTVLWEEVASVNRTAIQSRRAGVVVRTTNLCTLTIDGGETLQFSDATLQDVSVLCATVQERALVPLLKMAAMKLQSGESFSFGKLSASKVGLDTGRATIPGPRSRLCGSTMAGWRSRLTVDGATSPPRIG